LLGDDLEVPTTLPSSVSSRTKTWTAAADPRALRERSERVAIRPARKGGPAAGSPSRAVRRARRSRRDLPVPPGAGSALKLPSSSLPSSVLAGLRGRLRRSADPPRRSPPAMPDGLGLDAASHQSVSAAAGFVLGAGLAAPGVHREPAIAPRGGGRSSIDVGDSRDRAGSAMILAQG